MSNNLITIVYTTNKTNLGVSPLFYNWLKEPLWQHMYNTFQPYSDSVIILGLDTISDTANCFKEIKTISKDKKSRYLLVDISLPMISEDSINRMLSFNASNVFGIKREFDIISFQNKYYETEYNKYLGFDLVEQSLLLNEEVKGFDSMYSTAARLDTKIYSMPYEETFKLNNKKDALLLKHISSL